MAKSPLRFVLIVGIVNFFGDMTYEGGRAIVGPFLGSLVASAAIVGFVAGLGGLAGYALRSVSGYLVDRTPILGGRFSGICDQHAGGSGARPGR